MPLVKTAQIDVVTLGARGTGSRDPADYWDAYAAAGRANYKSGVVQMTWDNSLETMDITSYGDGARHAERGLEDGTVLILSLIHI